MARVGEPNSKHLKLPAAKISISDYISSCPDSVLHHIFSFLPIKQVVATSILAKRWRSVWTEVPNLDFSVKDYKSDKMSLADVVYRVLYLSKASSINAFRLLDENSEFKDHQIDFWVHNAVARGLKVLHLRRVDVISIINLPPHVLSCKTLVSLILEGRGINIPMNPRVCLPNLKKLQLFYVLFGSDESLPSLISGCPVLQDLDINKGFADKYCCNISSPTIVSLSVSCYMCSSETVRRVPTLQINTPALRHLKLYVNTIKPGLVQDLQIGTLDSLVEVDICLDYCSLGLVQSIYEVKCLKLRILYRCLQGCLRPLASTIPGRFCKLIKLDLDGDYRLLCKLLDIADNLQILNFRKCNTNISINWSDPLNVPKCLVSCLRKIGVWDFKDDYEMVKYFLTYAEVLKEMHVTSCSTFDDKQKLEALKTITKYPRVSNTCELVFH